ncbi:EAL domain-containing protein [Methylopila turkensis]|uniref:Diguanylate phosphodiesterase n=1 Tax=Methylopila turkensis TaxID=1437816 RepID=A0A9W6JQK9_9HYPH|nr:EAL domain-containing protein [Methylopila turkensis]GLK79999.1 diguanylate phosphodiesterase [Methylopila turkensis]
MRTGLESFDLLANAGCAGCRQPFAIDIAMAFQPIIDVTDGSVFAYEALVRGANGEGAAAVLAHVTPDTRFAFDQLCRRTAVEAAARLGIQSLVSINFMPNAVYEPALCLGTTLAAAQRHGFPIDNIMFEVTEGEKIEDRPHLTRILAEYKRQGFTTAIDDFGAGHSGLNLLAEFQPDVVKLDMDLIRGIDGSRVRQAILASMMSLAEAIGMSVVAEGIETVEEYACLKSMGVTLMQGYLFARPELGRLPAVVLPETPRAHAAVA